MIREIFFLYIEKFLIYSISLPFLVYFTFLNIKNKIFSKYLNKEIIEIFDWF